LQPWWKLFHQDKKAYEDQKKVYVERILGNAEVAVPGLRNAAEIILPGTPVTFQRFTRRDYGWVGGFPQTNISTSWGPRIEKNIYMVGDSIFPGQSTAAVSLGGLRVANIIKSNLDNSVGDL
jgi:phytoene dehydrogenase-like protein